eukprot:GFYU01006679.1.p1 GENE.GFYU01006679.1~~GFYU01006679.1.p1  ORF type:complete len:576 (+),score=98.70 GFYU01006679.1:93-1730(+)
MYNAGAVGRRGVHAASRSTTLFRTLTPSSAESATAKAAVSTSYNTSRLHPNTPHTCSSQAVWASGRRWYSLGDPYWSARNQRARSAIGDKMAIHEVEASECGRGVWVTFGDGTHSFYNYVWLRDNCPTSLSPSEQRLHETSDLADSVTLGKNAFVDLHHNEYEASSKLVVKWKDTGVTSTFDDSWLKENAYDPRSVEWRKLQRLSRTTLWNAKKMSKVFGKHRVPLPVHNFEDTVGPMVSGECKWGDPENLPQAMMPLYQALERYGCILLQGVPTEEGMVTRVGDALGFVRTTNYGRYFDVKTVPNPVNEAYSSKGLSNHTDNPYRDPTPGIQLIHCLIAAEGDQGTSTLVDGFAAAEWMRHVHPQHFEVLTTIPRSYRYNQRGIADLRAEWSPISVDGDGNVEEVRFNNRSAGPWKSTAPHLRAVRHSGDSTTGIASAAGTNEGREVDYISAMEDMYAAWREFGRALQDDRLMIQFKMQPGDLLVMMNGRVLHGRKAFEGAVSSESSVDTSTPTRHLQGCYIDVDEVRSRHNILDSAMSIVHKI